MHVQKWAPSMRRGHRPGPCARTVQGAKRTLLRPRAPRHASLFLTSARARPTERPVRAVKMHANITLPPRPPTHRRALASRGLFSGALHCCYLLRPPCCLASTAKDTHTLASKPFRNIRRFKLCNEFPPFFV